MDITKLGKLWAYPAANLKGIYPIYLSEIVMLSSRQTLLPRVGSHQPVFKIMRLTAAVRMSPLSYIYRARLKGSTQVA